MLVISGANDKRFLEPLAYSASYVRRHGYTFWLYDFECKLKQGRGFRDTDAVNIYHYKPKAILHTITNRKELCVWIDAHSIMIRPIDEIDTGDYDVGVTLRITPLPGGRHGKYLASGTIFAYPTAEAERLIRQWDNAMYDHPRWLDQGNLYYLLNEHEEINSDRIGEVLDIQGTRVKLFPVEKYNAWNCVRDMEVSEAARIISFKHKLKEKWPEFRDRFLER